MSIGFVTDLKGERPLGRPRCRWKVKTRRIKECELESFGSQWKPVVGFVDTVKKKKTFCSYTKRRMFLLAEGVLASGGALWLGLAGNRLGNVVLLNRVRYSHKYGART
jgi:predicted metallo-beta-lactamase superfamily hydrolase